MSKTRRIMIRVAAAVFAVVWVGYFVLFVVVMNNYSKENLHQMRHSIENQVSDNIEDLVNSSYLYLSGHGQEEFTTRQDVEDFLYNLPQTEEDVTFRIVDYNGFVYTSDSVMLTTADASRIAQDVAEKGYSITNLRDNSDRTERVMVCLPFPGSDEYYFAQVMRPETFAAKALQNLDVDGLFLGVYNQHGTELAFEEVSWDSDGDTQAEAQQFEKARTSLQTGAHDVASMVQTVDNFDVSTVGQSDVFWQSSNMYVMLGEPSGWFLGVYVPPMQSMPFLPILMVTMLLVFASGIVVLFLALPSDTRKKEARQKSEAEDILNEMENDEIMQQALKDLFRKRQEKEHCIVCLDIAAFHRFNAMFGYASGDRLLYVVGNTLRTNYNACTRISGDVFAVLTPITPTFIEDLEELLYSAIRQELGTQYQQVIVFKFGVYPIIEMPRNYREIFDGALMAVKEAKGRPKQNVVVYDTSFQNQVSFQKNVEINMLHALSKEEFVVYVQPKMDVKTRGCSGGEALIRWNSEQMGFIMPDQFIPIFERNGFIMEIDFFVLTTVLKYQQDALDNGRPLHPVSVNQSKVTISFPNYLERLRKTIDRFSVPLEYVEIEITEGALESDYESMISLMYSLKEMGFSVAMDDFGTGYSSLNTLRVLPVDVIKIDKGFLRESDTSDRSRKIIKNVINMSKELGIAIVCEGVETELQFEFLNDIGCDYIQGYLFAKPMQYDEYTQKYSGFSQVAGAGTAAPAAPQPSAQNM